MDGESLRDIVEREMADLQSNPAAGRGANPPATARLEAGRRVRIEGPNGWSVVADEPASAGGRGIAPSPGWFLRAGLASCDVAVLETRSAMLGIDLTALEVRVESESDARGQYGIDDEPPGPSSVRVTFRLSASNADADRLADLVAWTEAHSPMGHAIREPVPMDHQVVVE